MKFCATTVLALATFILPALPATSQTHDGLCQQVRDPDGWVNVRSVVTGEVVGRFYNGTEFYFDRVRSRRETNGEHAVLLGIPTLMVHRSRLRTVRGTHSCKRYYSVSDPDGWSNVRRTPNGEVLTTVNSGEHILVIGRRGNWAEVVTPDGTFGFMHYSRLFGPHFLRL